MIEMARSVAGEGEEGRGAEAHVARHAGIDEQARFRAAKLARSHRAIASDRPDDTELGLAQRRFGGMQPQSRGHRERRMAPAIGHWSLLPLYFHFSRSRLS